MIFARKSDAALASLVKQVDELLAKHSDKKLSSFVNLLGEDRDALESDAKKFASEHKIAGVPIVVPVETENGPANFGINEKAEVTVILYSGMKVKANHAFAPGKLDKKGVAAVVADVPKLLE
ncbi:MAG TPA: hypothetical protein VGX78_02825 [Pirellulales bacterium]|jgi:hypothetical protein|nr:hypothetical protein [Pirellulales bacterium]